MKFALIAFAVLSYLVAASLAADDKCKYAKFDANQTLRTGEKQVVEWQCKGNAKTDLVYLEIGKGKGPDDYAYMDTIDAKAKASLGKFSFILKDYPSGDYISRMLTISAKETLPVEEAERAQLPWTYSPSFKIENSKESTDNSSSSDGNTTTDDNNNSSSSDDGTSGDSTNRNTTANQDGANQTNAADAISIFGSTVLFCAGVLATFLVL